MFLVNTLTKLTRAIDSFLRSQPSITAHELQLSPNNSQSGPGVLHDLITRFLPPIAIALGHYCAIVLTGEGPNQQRAAAARRTTNRRSLNLCTAHRGSASCRDRPSKA